MALGSKGMSHWVLFVQIVINMLSLSVLAQQPSIQKLNVAYFRPGVGQNEDLTFTNFANDFDSFNALHKQVVLDVCNNVVDYNGTAEYTWQFEDRLGTYLYKKKRRDIKANKTETERTVFYASQVPKSEPIITKECQTTWYAPREGSYNVRVLMKADGETVARGGKVVDVRDIWYVVLGDSYMSGQGNPDKDQELGGVLSVFLGTESNEVAKWIDTDCYQSSLSHPFLVYEKLEKKYKNYGILFTFLACSGASIDEGIYGSHAGKPSQIQVLQDIQREARAVCPCSGCCKTEPDFIYQGVGANDLDFEDLAAAIANPLGDKEPYFQGLAAKKQNLRNRINRLESSFKSMRIPPKSVFYVEYFDMLRNEKGNLDASCTQVGSATLEDFKFLDTQFMDGLNQIINTKCRSFGWNYLDFVDEAYEQHGICSRETYIRTIKQSLAKQGNLLGSYHPNTKGHKVVADVVWKQMDKPVGELLDGYEAKLRKSWTRKYSTRPKNSTGKHNRKR